MKLEYRYITDVIFLCFIRILFQKKKKKGNTFISFFLFYFDSRFLSSDLKWIPRESGRVSFIPELRV